MDSLDNVRKTWEGYAEQKPHWSVLTTNTDGQSDEFYQSGKADIEEILGEAESVGIQVSAEKALDFGCGVGRLTYPLCDRFDEVTAIDISSKMIELASSHEKCPANAKFIQNSESDLSFLPDDSFDFILSLIVLQHMPKRFMRKFVREFARVAKPGGTIVFQVPTYRERIVTEKAKLWTDKPLRSDNPAFHTLCYRCVARSLRWTKRVLKRRILSNEVRYRCEYAWLKITGQEFMQMNTLSDKRVRKILKKESCEVVAAREDGRTGEGYRSYLYFIRKIK